MLLKKHLKLQLTKTEHSGLPLGFALREFGLVKIADSTVPIRKTRRFPAVFEPYLDRGASHVENDALWACDLDRPVSLPMLVNHILPCVIFQRLHLMECSTHSTY